MDKQDERRVSLKNLLLSSGFKILEEEIGELLLGHKTELDVMVNKPMTDLGLINFKAGQKDGILRVVGILESLREELENSPNGR